MKKKSILFVIDSLGCGGAELALINLLKNIDYKKYSVDLLYFNQENEYFRNEVPKEVNILTPCIEMQIIFSTLKNLKNYIFNYKNYLLILMRIYFGICGKLNYSNYFNRKIKDWKKYRKLVPHLNKEYDVAISYVLNTSTYYVIDKVYAKKYIGWQHIDYKEAGCDINKDIYYFRKFDVICTITKELKNKFLALLPKELTNKVIVFENIIDIERILKNAKKKEKFDLEYNGIKIITVGSLRKVKGYDVIIKACKILKEKKYLFKWYILGEGEEKEKIKKEILKENLKEYLIMLGNKKNPYYYMENSDIYVQTSYREAFSTTIFEAKCLKKPIVITNASGMKEQIENGRNGLIAEIGNELEVAAAIEALIIDPQKRKRISSELGKDLQNYKNELLKKKKLFEKIILEM